MMPSAPKSSARLAVANSPTGMRTIAAAPPWRTCAIPDKTEAVSQSPCCPSSVTAGKPSRPTSSATIGEGSPHQPLWTVSPALSRRASEKAVAVVMGGNRPLLPASPRSRHHAGRDGGSRPAGIEWLPAACRHRLGTGATSEWALAARFDLLDRFRHQFVHGSAHLVIRHDDRLGIGVGLSTGEAELLRRPQAEELVATGVRLESQFLVEDELLLEAFLTLVERSHACLAISGAAGRSCIGSQPFGRDACRVNLERLQHPALEPRAALHSGTQSSRQPTAK